MKKKTRKKYDEFEHWLAMFGVHQNTWTKESIEDQIDMYRSIEGDEELKSLQEEVRLIIQNDDLHLFLDRAKVKLSDLQLTAELIVSNGTKGTWTRVHPKS